jgi:hypothetical protein
MPLLKHITTKYAAPAETEKESRNGDGYALRRREGNRQAVAESLTTRNLGIEPMPRHRHLLKDQRARKEAVSMLRALTHCGFDCTESIGALYTNT